MIDEPRRHRAYLALLALTIVGGAPFAFIGSEAVGPLGFPAWLWSSFLFTAGLSAVTVWGVLGLWRDERFD